ncbi:glycogen synthase [Luteolibacter marinus]|uniref:glycogen synthase n=1 Tax=Luteolibacter marinus TaxID=2776705 RepID=UPI0018679DC9|nr:glycogen/starch synthase [Luteolibacter marinus]
MSAPGRRPRILVVTPEITCLPARMGPRASAIRAKAGGLADATASLVDGLERRGAEVHVAIPHYRKIFRDHGAAATHDDQAGQRIHLADDAFFHHQDRVYRDHSGEAQHAALLFQREVIHRIIPAVQPDLIHCNDWMTSLIPAAAKARGIRSLFTIHNVHSHDVTLSHMAAAGMAPQDFWQHLFYARAPGESEHARWHGAVRMLTSGIFAADHVNTVSPGFLRELADGHHGAAGNGIQHEIRQKLAAGRASGVLNAPDPSFDPGSDPALAATFGAGNHAAGKAANKRALQEELGLEPDPAAPVFFWPSRLDPTQKGPELLAEILHRTLSDHWHRGLQVAIIADGPFQHCLRQIVDHHGLHRRVAVHGFDERLARLGHAGADFMLMPSRFEPCGLPQMIAPLYGCLPVVHATGGLRDTVRPLDVGSSSGNGFRFEDADGNGLRWAIDQAMIFHQLPPRVRQRQIRRIMAESRDEFDAGRFTENYLDLYASLLGREVAPSTRSKPAAAPPPRTGKRRLPREKFLPLESRPAA